MRVSVLATPSSRHQVQHQQAMAEGLRAMGHEPVLIHYARQCTTKHVVVWGWRNGKPLRERGHEVLVMERGYIGDRFKHTSLGWNGLNGHATFPTYEDDKGKRFAEHGGRLLPWNSMGGESVLILGQVPTDMSLQGKDLMPWYETMVKQIDAIGLEPVFRPHPDLARKGIRQVVKGATPSTGTLDDALANAMFTICYNSNSSVDSVLAGVPCVIGNKGSMATPMCHLIEDRLVLPVGFQAGCVREGWANQLAFKQWTVEEIAAAKPLWKLF